MSALQRFVRESNLIEGILRQPTAQEISALLVFLRCDPVTREDILHLTAVNQPDAQLRDRAGLDVAVGTYFPPRGGPEITLALDRILESAADGRHPYWIHHAYESLHPLTDGNGRSGRALWLWGMQHHLPARTHRAAVDRGFLHTWYYQSLDMRRPDPSMQQIIQSRRADLETRLKAAETGPVELAQAIQRKQVDEILQLCGELGRQARDDQLTIGEIARAEAVSVEAEWEGNPHRHPGQLSGRMCHNHDGFGYHCHDLVAHPGVEPGRMYR